MQAEQRAAIPHEVELDVAAASIGLEVTLALAIGCVVAALDDGQIGRQEGVAHGAQHREALLEAEFREIVEEDAADAARLVAVLQEKIVVAPALEARMQVGAEGRQRVATRLVEMPRILLDTVIRRQVHAAAEPHHWLAP